MKASFYPATVYCECGEFMFKPESSAGGTPVLMCLNSNCKRYQVEYELPTIWLTSLNDEGGYDETA